MFLPNLAECPHVNNAADVPHEEGKSSMAIEKMALVQIEGALKKVNKTLVKCCESNCFHIIANNQNAPEHGNESKRRGFKTLKTKNPYLPLLNRATALANGLNIKIRHSDYESVDLSVSVDFANYLKKLEEKYNVIYHEKKEIEDSLKNHTTALLQVEQVVGLDVDFKELYACKYMKMRFGRLPMDSIPKLSYYQNRGFVMHQFQRVEQYVWVLYLALESEADEIDDIFNSLYFERVRFPDYFQGNADEAKSAVLKLIKEENEKLLKAERRIKELSDSESDYFLRVLSKLTAIEQSYELRQNVLAINGKFFMSGYVPKRKVKEFTKILAGSCGVIVHDKPLDIQNASPPVMLRNNWLFRPFEMFVRMYGLPNYNSFDPTPFVGITFMLIFGIMFGDLGQGLLISVLGIILHLWKNVKLAGIMERIGITSAIFGVLYGSVFGNEEMITPFFKIPGVYHALGYSSAPEDIFQVSTILLLAAIGLGVTLVVISMLMNIVTSLKNGEFADALIGPSGITGIVFYVSVMAGAALQLGAGIKMFTTPYLVLLIILPLAILFFKEPIIHSAKKMKYRRIQGKSNTLIHAVKSYSGAVSDLDSISTGSCSLENVGECRYTTAQYGLLPARSYAKLESLTDAEFVFFPFENDGEYIQGVFMAMHDSFAIVERAFEGVGFKKMKMPSHIEDIHKEGSLNISRFAQTDEKHDKKSVGTFIIEGIIELFESCLTYITNTMSFLRIGGFILSHAGMMLVISVLAEKAGAGAIVVQILGNLFVIGMEGFLVGIQVLRLEFYEIFSRFFKGGGKPFKPVMVDINIK